VNDANKLRKLKVTESKILKKQYMDGQLCVTLGARLKLKAIPEKKRRGKEKSSVCLILYFYSYRHRKAEANMDEASMTLIL
jgi:hypothetical protein